MKKVILIFLGLYMASCAPAPGSNAGNNNQISSENSPESQAKILTEKMKESLTLNEAQAEKILMTNVINLKMVKRLRENRETDKLSSTKQKYQEEIKNILTEPQFTKFLAEFGDN